MANEEVIRQQMEETRTSLTEKLETLENKVVQTVQGATDAVSDTVATITGTVQDTVDSVKDSVASVKDSVEDTVSTVKDSVAEGVETAKEYVDVRGYVESYPWLSLSASVAAGYALGMLLGRRQEQPSAFAKPIEAARMGDGRTHHRNGGHHRRREEKSQGASWLGEFAPEISKLKGMALGALLGTAREMIAKSMPGHMGQQISQLVDNITTKLGGEPMSHSDWESIQKTGGYSSEGGGYESRDEAKMGGPVGSTRRQGPQTMGRFDR
jgi:ElaB/YqjD/DUF883 family membrane-anchored ribosome-binding protein